MYWTTVKNALVYGQPALTDEMLQPQNVKIAVQEIERLNRFGWIDDLSEEMLQRIKTACHKGQCLDIWEELALESRVRVRKTRKRRKRASKPRPDVS